MWVKVASLSLAEDLEIMDWCLKSAASIFGANLLDELIDYQ